MTLRLGLVAAVLGLAGLALWHPAPRPAIQPVNVATAALDANVGASSMRPRRRFRQASEADELVVYVVGAVKKPGLYRLRPGDRYARAIALAGGFRASADASGVNLAQRAADGEEIEVPAVGAAPHARRSERRGERRGRRHASPPPPGSVDVNAADAAELAAVPGIGRAVAGRIVELRAREGSFASLDELLDVAGMTQSRLERARPYLRDP